MKNTVSFNKNNEMTTSRNENIFDPQGATAIGKRAAFARSVKLSKSKGRNDSDNPTSALARHQNPWHIQTNAATMTSTVVSPSGGVSGKVASVSREGDGIRLDSALAFERGVRTEGVGRGVLALPATAGDKAGIPADEHVMMVVFNPTVM